MYKPHLGMLSAAIAIAAWPALATSPSPSPSPSPSALRGRAFAATNCARCHSIDKVTASRLSIAPPFRSLHNRYAVESLEEALVEGIVTGHPTMPEFQLDPDQVADFINFLKTLEQ